MVDPLGVSPGFVSEAGYTDLKNDYPTIKDIPIEVESQRIQPSHINTGTNRGSQVIVGASNVPQVLSGDQFKFGQGFFVTKPGIDVTSNTDPNQFIFNSNQNVLKVQQSGVATILITSTAANSTNADSATINYDPTKTTKPLVFAFTDTGASGSSIPWNGISPESRYSSAATNPIGFQILIRFVTLLDVTNGKITFQAIYHNATTSAIGGGGQYTVNYFIMQESIQ